ncbi:hypothetical protein [Caenispirillum salinarum]|uniref:hypothetical protein n=1 Tax=Caenispirillum salinarum TaxID=859058 RepID=UPI00384F46A8
MSIHGISSSATAHARPPGAPLMWRRSRVDFTYPPLASIDPMREGLSDVPGVVVVWNAARADADEPAGRCLYVGQTCDLAAAVGLLRDDPALAAAQGDDLRVTWAPIGIAHRPGVVAYLRDMLNPKVAECALDVHWPVRPDARPVPVPLPS